MSAKIKRGDVVSYELGDGLTLKLKVMAVRAARR